MPTLLESNPAGDLTLIESGCYGFTGTRANGYQFDDPSLTDWTARWSSGGFSVDAGVLSVDKGLLLMWDSPSVSPQHTLPNRQITTVARGRWDFDDFTQNGEYLTNAVAIMHPSILPWSVGGFAMGAGGKVFFSTMWHWWSYENGVFQSYHNGLIAVPASTDHWMACRVEPDGTALVCDCSSGGKNLIQGAHGFQPDAPFTNCVCDTGNYDLAGNPGLVSWQLEGGLPDTGTEYFEWHAFYGPTIKVVGLPSGWKARIIKVGDAVRKATTETRTESGGEATVPVVGGGDQDMPPWDEVQVLDPSNVVMATIQVRTFQPGTYGGDVYCYQCAFPCPPPNAASFFFFGQQIVQAVTRKLTMALDAELWLETMKQETTSLDAMMLTGSPIQQDGSGFLYEDDFASAVSSDWEALAGSLYVWTAGQARGAAGDKMGLKESVIAARNKSYCQAKLTRGVVSGTGGINFFLRRNSDEDAYIVQSQELVTRLIRRSNGGDDILDSSGLGNPDNTQMLYHHYCADGDQRSWRSGAVRAVETNTDLDGQTGVLAFSAFTAHSDIDDVVYCTDRLILFTGLPTGWKAKVLDSGDAVVVEATESGGTATIDTGGKEIPIGGWPALIITDAADGEVLRWDSGSGGFAGVYPGDSYSF